MWVHSAKSQTTGEGNVSLPITLTKPFLCHTLFRVSPVKWLLPDTVHPFALTQAYHHPHHLYHTISLPPSFLLLQPFFSQANQSGFGHENWVSNLQ